MTHITPTGFDTATALLDDLELADKLDELVNLAGIGGYADADWHERARHLRELAAVALETAKRLVEKRKR